LISRRPRGILGPVPHVDRRRGLAALAIGAGLCLVLGCAANPARRVADREACAKLVAAVKISIDTGSAPLDPETAAFAKARGLGENLAPDPGGGGSILSPRSFPFPLILAADPRDGGPRYRAAADSYTPEYRRMLAEEGRRCEW
jgi:hypothetical protein